MTFNAAKNGDKTRWRLEMNGQNLRDTKMAVIYVCMHSPPSTLFKIFLDTERYWHMLSRLEKKMAEHLADLETMSFFFATDARTRRRWQAFCQAFHIFQVFTCFWIINVTICFATTMLFECRANVVSFGPPPSPTVAWLLKVIDDEPSTFATIRWRQRRITGWWFGTWLLFSIYRE